MVGLARSLSEQITIAADSEAIMAVVADVDRLPQWVHPMKRVQVHERFPDGRPKLVHFWVATAFVRDDFRLEFGWEGNHRVSWHQLVGRLLREQVGSYTLTDDGEHTQVRYELAVLMKLPIPGFIQRLATEIIMAHALSGLKAPGGGILDRLRLIENHHVPVDFRQTPVQREAMVAAIE